MKVVPFIAESPAVALAQIHQQLGPDAVVVSVRPLPRQGLARLWQKSTAVEVLACVAEPGEADASWERRGSAGEVMRMASFSHDKPSQHAGDTLALTGGPSALEALHDGTGRPHVFIGPPGIGKTTLLCKWMTWSVLNEHRAAKAWRLDGPSANTAEFLTVFGEMLGVSVERFWNPPVRSLAFRRPGDGDTDPMEPEEDLLLIDVPGVQAGDAETHVGLKHLLAGLPSPRIHLVLNAAYETSILSEQFRAFATFLPEDVSFTHLDEEKRQGKLLDFIVGTNCSLRFLSTGQKIPGDLVIAGVGAGAGSEFVA